MLTWFDTAHHGLEAFTRDVSVHEATRTRDHVVLTYSGRKYVLLLSHYIHLGIVIIIIVLKGK